MSTSLNLAAQTNLNSSLYCGDLRKEVTEANLFRIFNAVGPVSSIRVCRDAISRQSLGYAYINFVNPVDAERALDTMNFTPINSKPCRLMWSERNPEKRKRHEANLFICNLHPTIDNKTLFDTFSMFGDILSCKIQTDDNGVSLGYGFVHYTTKSAAEKALQRVNGMEIAGKKVLVCHHKARNRREKEEKKEDAWTNLYVKNFPSDWNEDKLKELVSPHGECTVCISKKEDGTSKGFGFVNFKKHEDAKKALEALAGVKFGEESLYVSRHRSKVERQKMAKDAYVKEKQARFQRYQGLNLYVKNLPSSCDDEKLRSLFEPFGTITSTKVMFSKEDQKSKGFGFVCFEKKEMAEAAIKGMHSKMVDNKPLFVCMAEMKEQRMARFQNQSRHNVFRPNREPTQMKPHTPGGFPRATVMRDRAAPRIDKTAWGPQRMPPQYPMPYGGGYPMMPRNPIQMTRPGLPPMQPIAHQHPQRLPMQYGQQPTQKPPHYRQMNPGASIKGAGRTPQWGVKQTKRSPKGGGPTKQPTTNQELISQLAVLDNAQAKQLLGEKLFVEIAKYEKDAAGKITGMLLEMDNTELILLLEDKTALRKKILEALNVLKQHAIQGPAE